MKLLLDENISWRLVAILKSYYDEVLHISFSGLPKPIKDMQIWDFAKEQGYIIITNDSDFVNLSGIFGFPPKVVLLLTGNQSSHYLYHLLINKQAEIQILSTTNDYGIIEIF